MFVHELIDHGAGVCNATPTKNASLRHLIFDNKEAADAYVLSYVSYRQREFQYIYREWGIDSLTKLWIEDHRTKGG